MKERKRLVLPRTSYFCYEIDEGAANDVLKIESVGILTVSK
jgi:hypothetical protein